MFKSSQQPRTKSPYQPKLLQHLINSSDDDSSQSNSQDQNDKLFSNSNEQQKYKQRYNNSRFSQLGTDDRRSQKSSHTTLTQQTIKSNVTRLSNENNKANVTKSNFRAQLKKQLQEKQMPKSNTERPAQLRANENKFQRQSVTACQISHNKRSSHFPVMNIKYDSLKLSEYNTDGIRGQQQLYERNMKQFKERFNPSKPSHIKRHGQQNVSIGQEQDQDEDYIDSLQAMKRSNINKKNLSRLTHNESSTPSSRIKFLQQNRQARSNQKEPHNQAQSQAQTEKLRQELKRSKDVIRTLGLKNTDLQKTLQMRNTKIDELESEPYGNSRMSQTNLHRNRAILSQQTYDRVALFMKQKVKEFLDGIRNIKISPILEQNLQNFLAQIIQINQVTVKRTLGISQNQILTGHEQPVLPATNNLTKSIPNIRSPLGQNTQPNNQSNQLCSNVTNRNLQNRFKTAESHITINSRENSFINARQQFVRDRQGASGMTVKVDLSTLSNKQNITPNKNITPDRSVAYNKNITPNKRANADEQFRQLEKSLQKLKNMEKDLCTTPIAKQYKNNPSNPSYRTKNFNQDQQKKQYSVVNRNYFTNYGKQNEQDQNGLNISGNNLDRSKSKRKKIFADTNQK